MCRAHFIRSPHATTQQRAKISLEMHFIASMELQCHDRVRGYKWAEPTSWDCAVLPGLAYKPDLMWAFDADGNIFSTAGGCKLSAPMARVIILEVLELLGIKVAFVYVTVAAYNHPSAYPDDRFFAKGCATDPEAGKDFEYHVEPTRQEAWGARVQAAVEALDRANTEILHAPMLALADLSDAPLLLKPVCANAAAANGKARLSACWYCCAVSVAGALMRVQIMLVVSVHAALRSHHAGCNGHWCWSCQCTPPCTVSTHDEPPPPKLAALLSRCRAACALRNICGASVLSSDGSACLSHDSAGNGNGDATVLNGRGEGESLVSINKASPVNTTASKANSSRRDEEDSPAVLYSNSATHVELGALSSRTVNVNLTATMVLALLGFSTLQLEAAVTWQLTTTVLALHLLLQRSHRQLVRLPVVRNGVLRSQQCAGQILQQAAKSCGML
ncbi:hypothetical protein JKP88DRAFT_247540 [Tribonema minus]|uniref:Uncharacterized protein n=1 Tax=Tribonema minus TaxID=303371 RepID=A0A835YQ29_9STRA|nr:hypothetical protein JKP88DRAFT_247540 [Tribonema minus]